ncbi:hypothetical protein BDZ89DRAFT_1075354 [Hymenopellis radicata]|nr:hypothetical protein BDZ89DRAFT_1075354 [Hymenopellis radicata]
MLVSPRGMVPGPGVGTLPEMSCPILPSSAPHPLEREAVHCTPPLPWPDCFHPTLARTVVRVPYATRDVREHGQYQLVPQNEAMHLIELSEHDAEWRQEIEAAYQAVQESEHDAQSVQSSSSEDSELPGASNIASTSSLQPRTSYDDWLNETPLVKFTFDLEKISPDEISNPWEFQEEHDAYTEVKADAKRRVRHKVVDIRKLDDEYFTPKGSRPDPNPADHLVVETLHNVPELSGASGDEDIQGDDDWSSEYEGSARSVLSDIPEPVSSPAADASPPPWLTAQDRLEAALDLTPRKVSNASGTEMPDRDEFIAWEKEVSVKMGQMFADMAARGKKQDHEASDEAIVKRTQIEMMYLPDARPQQMQALAAAFQREREPAEKSEPDAIDQSADVPTEVVKASRLGRLLIFVKKVGTFFGCHS